MFIVSPGWLLSPCHQPENRSGRRGTGTCPDPETEVAKGNSRTSALGVVALIPVVVVFLIFQRRIVEGVATTGLKG
ncbi:hypothetical protein [Kribbella speibonae]|uniref:hypothetical protein n=1 Tax=Kribbella speibonae TaxID=1572660 RepID=UPI00192DE1F4|nr:hypothetical protein [Kribbella speibonae]